MSKKFTSKPKRPVNRETFQVRALDINTAQVPNVVHVAAVAETFSGGNAQIAWACNLAGVVSTFMLIVLREGHATPAIDLSSGAVKPFPAEADMLWTRTVVTDGTTGYSLHAIDRIKTQRKLKPGDRLLVLYKSSSANGGDINLIFNLFYKQ